MRRPARSCAGGPEAWPTFRESHGAGRAGEGPRVRRIFSHPLILLACLAGAALIDPLIDLLLPASWAVTLLDRTRSTYPLTVQNITGWSSRSASAS